MKQYFKWLMVFFILGTLGFSTEVFAALFDVVPTDKSKEYLGTIFGGSVGLVYLGGGANPLLSKMFEQFNFVVVTIGTLVISYAGIMSVINTAREGEALGKKFSAWVVMRAFIGMLLMIPTPATGYSIVQVTVMWVVLNGIGAANLVWGVVLDQLGSGIQAVGSVGAMGAISSNLDGRLNTVLEKVRDSVVCMQAINNQTGGSSATNAYGPIKLIRVDRNLVMTTGANGVRGGDITSDLYLGVEGSPNNKWRNICGHYTVSSSYSSAGRSNVESDVASDARYALDVKINAFSAMLNTLSPAASLLLQDPPQNPSPGYGSLSKEAYKSQIALLSAMPRSSSSSIDIGDLKKIGWIHAGNYYFALSQSSNNDMDQNSLSVPTGDTVPTTVGLDNWRVDLEPSGPGTWSRALKDQLKEKPNRQISKLNNALARAPSYINSDTPPDASIPNLISNNPGTGDSTTDKMIKALADPLTELFINFMQDQMEGGNGDPILGLARFGWGLMTTAEISAITMMMLAFGISLLASPMMCVSPAAPPVNMLLIQLWLIISGLCVMLWTAGATLNIYLPMVPYLVFTSTAFGWMMAVTEAIVGAPIIALGLVQPGGEEMGKISAGLGILANIFLRPMLMIFGFILAAGMVRAGVKLINFGFVSAVTGKPPMSTMFSFIAVLMLYMMFMIAIFNKAFSLIYELPNKVLRYMGVAEERHEPSEMVQQGKSGFESGAKAGQKAAGTGLESVSKKIEKDREKQSEGGGGGGGGGGAGGATGATSGAPPVA